MNSVKNGIIRFTVLLIIAIIIWGIILILIY